MRGEGAASPQPSAISLPELTHDLEIKELEARQQGKSTAPCGDKIRGSVFGCRGHPKSLELEGAHQAA